MKRTDLCDSDGLKNAINCSYDNMVIIFKHSTRCSISKMALYRVEGFNSEKINEYYYLDLINYRNVSDEISEKFNLEHQSPQVLLIRNGKLIHHASHNAIKPNEWAVYLE